MQHETVGLFAQPITKVNLNVTGIAEFFDNHVRGNSETKNKINIESISNSGLRHYHNDDNVFEVYPELKDLGDRILNAANFVYQEVLNHNTTLRITNAWFNECDIGSEQFTHNHCNCIISGTLYLRTDENTSINFKSPFTNTDFAPSLVDYPDVKKPNKYGYNYHFLHVTVSPSDGDCLFWGSHINHGYPLNKTPGRLSLSFNMVPTTFNCTYKV